MTRSLIATLVTAVVLAAAGFVYALNATGGRPAAHGGTGRSLVVDGVPVTTLGGTNAPGFSLVDQDGRHLSLTSLRGRAVVLEFMDPHCTDICPIVAAEYQRAYRDLGPLARNVAFVAVNVNAYHRSLATLRAFSREQGLQRLPNWHFVTGPVPALRRVWHDYGIWVKGGRHGDVKHSSVVYVIDPSGRERYLLHPVRNRSSEARFGSAIATLAERALR